MSSGSKSLRILVTDANELAGCGAVRSLGRAGHVVTAGYPSASSRPAVSWSQYCATTVAHPDPWLHPSRFCDWLLGSRHSWDVILPISEAAMVGVARLRDELAPGRLLILPNPASMEVALSKYRATRMALDLGICCPRTVFVHGGDTNGEWHDDLSSLRFPLVIKCDNHFSASGRYRKGKSIVAANAEEAAEVLRKLRSSETAVMAQERVPGYGVGAFFCRFQNRMQLTFTHRRLHEVPFSGGVSSYRESSHDQECLRSGKTLLDGIGYEGLAMVEFRLDRDTSKPYFLEVNGRLWGSIALALHAGVDFPKTALDCYRQAEKSSPTPTAYQVGVRCRNVFPGEIAYVHSVLFPWPGTNVAPAPSKIKTLLSFVALCFDPRVHHDYFWWDDPLPGLAQALQITKYFIRLALQKVGRRIARVRNQRLLSKLKSQQANQLSRQTTVSQLLTSIVFVCHGNICRSRFAEQYWNERIRLSGHPGPLAISRGLFPSVEPAPAWIVEMAKKHDVDLAEHRPVPLSEQEVQSVDYVVVMDMQNYRDVIRRFPWARQKTCLLGLFNSDAKGEIQDPVLLSVRSAELSFENLVKALQGLLLCCTPGGFDGHACSFAAKSELMASSRN